MKSGHQRRRQIKVKEDFHRIDDSDLIIDTNDYKVHHQPSSQYCCDDMNYH